MTEAFEIGVSLALGDGVGEATERAHRDVTAMETAVNAGCISIQRLRAAAAESIPPKSDSVSYDGSWPRLSQQRSAESDIHDASNSPQAELSSTYAAQFPEIASMPQEQFLFLPPPSTPSAGFTAGGGEASAVRQVAIQSAFLPEQSLRHEIDMPADAAFKPWSAPSVHTDDSFQAPGTASNTQAQVHTVSSTVLNAIGLTASPKWQVAAASAAKMPTYDWGTLSNTSAPVQQEHLEVAAGPILSKQRDRIPSSPSFSESTGADRTASTQAGESSRGPTEGDVYLDDMLVGRWMSRFLSRAAGRAPVGPTAFDPRRSRLLPGATVGI